MGYVIFLWVLSAAALVVGVWAWIQNRKQDRETGLHEQ